ncbi:hypothetical protein J6590_100033 [Homalodisca vitripennis]|nr:hypothetical protein J6590_100033 [Homalodisca vitripennis]
MYCSTPAVMGLLHCNRQRPGDSGGNKSRVMFVGEIGRHSSYLEGGGVAPTEDLLFITNLLVEILGESGQNESLKGFCQRKKREIGSCQNLKIKVNHFTTRSGSLLSAGVPRWSDLYAFFGQRLEKGPATSASVMPENSSVSSHSFWLVPSTKPCTNQECSESRIWWLRRAGTEAPRSHLHP